MDGLRGLWCAYIIFYHIVMYWGQLHQEPHRGYSLFPLKLVQYAPLGPEFFFLMTGAWATLQLMPEMEKNSSFQLCLYYKRRVLKLIPPYFSTMVLIALFIEHRPDKLHPSLKANHNTVFEYCHLTLPLNFLLMNNFVGFGGCGTQYWSLSAQMHFYIVFPLFLLALKPRCAGFRGRVAKALLCCIGAVSLLRWLLSSTMDMKMPFMAWPDPNASTQALEPLINYYHWMYFPTPTRLITFSVGSLLGVVCADKRGVDWLVRNKHTVYMCSILMLLVFGVTVVPRNVWGPTPEGNQSLFLAWGHHGSLLAALTTLAMVLPILVGKNRILHSSLVRRLASLSYSMYLLHMPVMYWIEAFLVPRGLLQWLVARAPVSTYFAMSTAVYGATVVAAAMHVRVHSKWIDKILW